MYALLDTSDPLNGGTCYPTQVQLDKLMNKLIQKDINYVIKNRSVVSRSTRGIHTKISDADSGMSVVTVDEEKQHVLISSVGAPYRFAVKIQLETGYFRAANKRTWVLKHLQTLLNRVRHSKTEYIPILRRTTRTRFLAIPR